MGNAVGTTKISQVGFVVNDIEETKKKWAIFLGMEVPPTAPVGKYSVTQTVYKGEPAPNAACKLAFFNMSNDIQIELIEPNESPSTWRDYLNEHGEGLHHIAFEVDDTNTVVMNCAELGINLVQQGQYGDASGQYTYMDGTKDLKCIIELLETYK